MDLNAFLNPVKEENVKFAASRRFVDDTGAPILWEIRPISGVEDEVIRKSCYKRVPGKKGYSEFDGDLYNSRLVAKSTVYPNLNDKQLQDAYGVMCAEDLVRVMLKSGEFMTYLIKVEEVNGFRTFEDMVEEAKN